MQNVEPRIRERTPAREILGVALLACVIGYLSAAYSGIAVVLVAGGIVAGFALRDVSYLIAASLCFHMVTEPFGFSYRSLSLGVVNLFPADILLLLLLIAFVFGSLRRGARPVRPHDPASILLTVYLLYGLFSVARSLPLYGKAALLSFRMHYLYALLYFLCLYALRRRLSRRRVMISVLVAATCLSLYGLRNAWTGSPIGSVTSTHSYHYLSSLEAMAIYFGLILLLGCLWPLRRPLWSIALGSLFVAAILVSQARSVWLGGMLGLIPLVLRSSVREYARARPLRTAGLLAAVVVLIAFFVGSADIGGDIAARAGSLTNVSGDVSAMWRLFVWLQALTELRASPIVGLGLGRQLAFFDVVRGNWEAGRQLHNSYLDLAYYTGAIGVALLVGFQAVVFVRVLRCARRHSGTPREALLLALAGCQVCLAAVTFANVVTESMVATTYTWILSAVAMLETREAGADG
jgi:O-antigen ligase